jgi:plastocyanin
MVLAVTPLALVPAAAAGGTGAAHAVVTIKHIAYLPARVTIRKGGSVTFKWKDGSIPHNVRGSGLPSSATKTSGSFTVRFTRRGTFSYHCTIHPWMKGSIKVV